MFLTEGCESLEELYKEHVEKPDSGGVNVLKSKAPAQICEELAKQLGVAYPLPGREDILLMDKYHIQAVTRYYFILNMSCRRTTVIYRLSQDSILF